MELVEDAQLAEHPQKLHRVNKLAYMKNNELIVFPILCSSG